MNEPDHFGFLHRRRTDELKADLGELRGLASFSVWRSYHQVQCLKTCCTYGMLSESKIGGIKDAVTSPSRNAC
jgi:hypothetical protein